ISWRLPSGILEVTLALLFVATVLSGLVGLYWSRTIPPLLARVGEEFIFERIPLLRAQMLERAEREVLETVRATGCTTLGDFFSRRLHRFFSRSRGVGYFLRPTSRLRRKL